VLHGVSVRRLLLRSFDCTVSVLGVRPFKFLLLLQLFFVQRSTRLLTTSKLNVFGLVLNHSCIVFSRMVISNAVSLRLVLLMVTLNKHKEQHLSALF